MAEGIFRGIPKNQIPKIQTEFETIAKKHGFKNFEEYDDVAASISSIMAGIDPETKKFTDARVAIQAEMEEVTADPTIPAAEKKKMLDELNEALKTAASVEYPSNTDLVLKGSRQARCGVAMRLAELAARFSHRDLVRLRAL